VALRVRAAGLVDAGLAVGFVAMWLGFLGSLHWTLDLFSHFRWQYLVLCIGAAVWILLTRRSRALIGFCLLSLAVNAASIVPLGRVAVAEAAAGLSESLRVVSLNVLTKNPHKAAVLDYLNAVSADVVFLMEVDRVWIEALAPLETAYPYRLTLPQADHFGAALYSRLPLKGLEVVANSHPARPSIRAELTFQDRELVIIGTHPPPPVGGAWSRARDAQLADLAAHVAETEAPVLLVGDLNTTPWSHGWRLLTHESGLRATAATRASWPTWMVRTPFAIPIDHALVTEPLVIAGREVGVDVGSDHRPQLIEVAWAN
jgi:endonuclease/exonuclease/phosphatase (EEP) superfamily protein YafD